MAKKTLNTTLSKSPDSAAGKQELNKLSESVLFVPTASQAKVKARFWTKFQPGPFTSSNNISLSVALEVAKSPNLRKWWAEPGFVEWFVNKEEERERIKYLFNKGLDTAEAMLEDPSVNGNAKANIIKMLAEMNGYLGRNKPVEKFADEDINKMNEDQLKAFLDRKGVKLVQEKIIDVPRDSSDENNKTAETNGEAKKGSASGSST